MLGFRYLWLDRRPYKPRAATALPLARLGVTLVSAARIVATGGVRLTFTGNVFATGAPVFTLSGFSGGAVTVTSITTGGSTPANCIDLNTSRAIGAGETGGSVTYGGVGAEAAVSGSWVSAFSSAVST